MQITNNKSKKIYSCSLFFQLTAFIVFVLWRIAKAFNLLSIYNLQTMFQTLYVQFKQQPTTNKLKTLYCKQCSKNYDF